MRVVRCVVSWLPGISTGGLLALMIALLAIACDAGSNSNDRPTPTPTVSASATAPHTVSPTPGFTTSPSPSPTPLVTATCPPVETATPTPGVVIPSPTTSATPTPGPYQSALDVTGASPEFATLGERLAHEIATYQALAGNIDVAVAVTDLQTGELIAVNGDVLHRSGCTINTINMFALFAVVGEFEAGRADPSRVAASIRAGIGSSYPPAVAQFLEAVFGSRDAGVERAQEMMRA